MCIGVSFIKDGNYLFMYIYANNIKPFVYLGMVYFMMCEI